MPIDDIAAEKAQQGEVDAETLSELGLLPQQAGQAEQTLQAAAQNGSLPNTIQVPADAQFWVDVATLLVLLGIFIKM